MGSQELPWEASRGLKNDNHRRNDGITSTGVNVGAHGGCVWRLEPSPDYRGHLEDRQIHGDDDKADDRPQKNHHDRF